MFLITSKLAKNLFIKSFFLIIVLIFSQGCLPANKNSAKQAVDNNVVSNSSNSPKAEAGNGQALISFQTTSTTSNKNLKTAIYTVTSNPDNRMATGSDSPILVTGLKNGTAYKFTIVNSLNPGVVISVPNAIIPAANAKTVSGAPLVGSAMAGNARATITFKAPAYDGGSPVVYYTVTSTPDNLYATGSSSPIIVSGLTNGITYSFKVTATNAIGASSASVETNSIIPMAPASIPGAPTIGVATAGNTTASVNFTAPATNGGAVITSYTVTSNPGNMTAVGSVSPIKISGLTNGIAYTFKVAATNAAGTGTFSNSSNSITPFIPAIIPGVPTIGVATAGNASAIVNFTAPVSNGGSVITSYIVTSNPGNFTATGASSPLKISGLTNGITYTFKVNAINAIGTGGASASSNNIIPVASVTIPGIPTIGAVTPGNASATINFTAPASNGGAAITNYSVTSNPGNIINIGAVSPIVMYGLTNGTAYTFTVKASNSIGTGLASTSSTSITPVAPATIPGVPTIGVAVGGNNSATISFAAPASNGGAAITNYIVTSNPGNITKLGSVSPIIVTGLTNGTTYTFTVKANNSIGMGPASVATNSITPTTPPPSSTVPGVPTIGVASAGNASATVNFSAPASNGGSAITSYTAISIPGNIEANGVASPIIVSGLTNGTAYTFSVKANSAIGSSLASAATNSITPIAPATAPGMPIMGVATAGNALATVNFIAPVSNGGAAITDYTATSNPGNIMVTGAASPIIVSGLTNGTAYTFSVKATNSKGTGSASAASNSVTPVTATTTPGAPTIGVATAGSASATINFTAPASNGGAAITSYTVTSNPGNIMMNGAASPITVTGLTNGTVYTFSVKATNSTGTGSASASTNSITPMDPVTVPGIPTIGVASAGNATATVSFTPPTSNGGSNITTYTVVSNPGNISSVGFASPITVTGLTNGLNYTFTVKATSLIGTGAISAASNSVIPVAPPANSTVPGAPTIGVALVGNANAIINFTPPISNGGSAIINYTVTSTPESIVMTGVTSPIIVTGLSNGVAYTFNVKARNSIGLSTASAASTSVTPNLPPDGAIFPRIPTIGLATAGNASATVNFTPPSNSVQDGVNSYTVTSNPGNIVASGVASPVVINGLTNGTAYTFTVKANNVSGAGSASVASNSVIPTTPLTVPDAPIMGVVTVNGRLATINFTPPANNGGAPITSYSVIGTQSFLNKSQLAIPIVTGNLDYDKTTTFTVRAINSVGAGPASAISNVVTAEAMNIGIPTIGVANAGNASATVNFTASINSVQDGVTSYTVTSNPGNIVANGVASPVIIKGLTNGTAYTFTVKANNVSGAGSASVASNSVIPSIPSVPSAPIMGDVTLIGTTATINFAAPISEGSSAIFNYYLEVNGVGNQSQTSTEPFIVTNLVYGISYTFRVKAVNQSGYSPYSALSKAINPLRPLTVPDAPSVGEVKVGDSKAIISFTPSYDGGSPITSFTVISTSGRTQEGTTSPITMNNLINGKEYAFMVKANNSKGSSAYSLLSYSIYPGNVGGIIPPTPAEGNFPLNYWKSQASNFQATGAAIDSAGSIYIANFQDNRILKYKNDGTFIGYFGSYGISDGQFSHPKGMTIDSSGSIYVVDAGNNRIMKFDSLGFYQAKFGSRGTNDGQFNFNCDSTPSIAIDSSKNVFITDCGNNRVQKFSSSGAFLSKFGTTGSGNGQFLQPGGILLDNQGNIFIADKDNNRIGKFNSQGGFISNLSVSNVNEGRPVFPNTLANVDSNGNITFKDHYTGSVFRIDSNANLLFKYDSSSSDAIISDALGNTYTSEDWSVLSLKKRLANGLLDENFGSRILAGEFNTNEQIKIDSADKIYVLDKVKPAVFVYDHFGKFLFEVKIKSTITINEVYSTGLTVDLTGNIYVSVNQSKYCGKNFRSIQKYSSAGNVLLEFAIEDCNPGGMNYRNDSLTHDSAGNIYMVNGDTVSKFNSSGVQLMKFGSTGTADNQFNKISDVAVNSNGEIFVADSGHFVIKKFNPAGQFMSKIGSSFEAPDYLGNYPKLTIDAKNNVYSLTDRSVTRFNSEGVYEFSFKPTPYRYALDSWQLAPLGVAVDKAGNIFMSDSSNHRVLKFDPSGNVLKN